MINSAIYFRVASVTMGQLYYRPSLSEIILKDMGKIGMFLFIQTRSQIVFISPWLSVRMFSDKIHEFLFFQFTVINLNIIAGVASWDRQPVTYLNAIYSDVIMGAMASQNYQPHDCLLNRLSRRKSKKTSKLRATGLCEGNSPVSGDSPHKGPMTRKMFPFDDVIMFLGQ